MKLPIDTEVTLRTGDTGVHFWIVEEERRTIVFTNFKEHLIGHQGQFSMSHNN